MQEVPHGESRQLEPLLRVQRRVPVEAIKEGLKYVSTQRWCMLCSHVHCIVTQTAVSTFVWLLLTGTSSFLVQAVPFLWIVSCTVAFARYGLFVDTCTTYKWLASPPHATFPECLSCLH